MKEQNREQLKAAIEQLPKYKAGPDIWEQLEKDLDVDKLSQEQNVEMQVATALLPTYSAPGRIWKRIEGAMSRDQNRPWRYAGRIAAVFLPLLALGAILWLWQPWASSPAIPVSEQTNPQSSLELPIAEDLSLNVLREQQNGLFACLEANMDWDNIRQSAEMTELLSLIQKADSLRSQGGADLGDLQKREQQLIRQLKERYDCKP